MTTTPRSARAPYSELARSGVQEVDPHPRPAGGPRHGRAHGPAQMNPPTLTNTAARTARSAP
jgi:hypothetical protein